MNFRDIIGMSAGNLWRRKLRTFLTVLGVIIGVASIVGMLSLGMGLKKSTMETIESYGSLTAIELYYWDNGHDSFDQMLTDSKIEEIEQMEYVTSVEPQLTYSVEFKYGNYICWADIVGISQEALSNIPIGEGRIPSADSGQLELLFGNGVIGDFYNTSTYECYWQTGELPDVDLMNDVIFTQLESTYTEDGQEIKGKRCIFPIVGLVEGNVETYNQYCYSVYTDIDALKTFLTKQYKGQTIPGQPTDKNGRPYKEFVYSSAIVNVDNMEHVETVLSAVKEMGYEAYSESEGLKETETQLKIIEMVLGGIGAISLFVAAIGIANTMMMSTYERTKEIGVMKVLGCSLNNIRMLFLTEAAFIGFIGGIIGVILTYGISAVINMVAGPAIGYENMEISYIPFWLPIIAVIFATFVGMAAGFFPAQRATKLSPLAAIRNE